MKAFFWIGIGIAVAALLPREVLVGVGFGVAGFAAFVAMILLQSQDDYGKNKQPRKSFWEWIFPPYPPESGTNYQQYPDTRSDRHTTSNTNAPTIPAQTQTQQTSTSWYTSGPPRERLKIKLTPLPEEDLDAPRHTVKPVSNTVSPGTVLVDKDGCVFEDEIVLTPAEGAALTPAEGDKPSALPPVRAPKGSEIPVATNDGEQKPGHWYS